MRETGHVLESTVKGCSRTVDKGEERNRRRDEEDRICVLERSQIKEVLGRLGKVKIGIEDKVKEIEHVL